MKKLLMFFALLVLVSASTMYAQTLMDYVLQVRGDTLVIKDFNDMNHVASSLTNALNLDTLNVPAGRVYMLKKNGYYPLAVNPTTSSSRPVVIMGEDSRPVVKNPDANSAPPLICGSTIEGQGSNTGGINWANALTVKNCNILPAVSDGSLGWAFFGSSAANTRLTLQNDLFERTRWVFVGGFNPGLKMYFKDCYFVNMTGQPCRRNGGVYDGFNNTDTLLVENCTHVMAQGSMWKIRNYVFNKIIFNHNTFVNCAGTQFINLGYESNMSVTNNIFVNCNVQPYITGITEDWGETDVDSLITGLVNVRDFPAGDTTYQQVPRKMLVEGNVAYWDPRLSDVVSTCNAGHVNNRTDWQDQMKTMNTRSQAMFNNSAAYPYLYEGVWFNSVPNFTNSRNLLTDQVVNLRAFAIATVDTASQAILPDWRLVNIGADNYIYSDWPVPVDLSYSNANLLTGATGGFPVGDLNWFPARKTQWDAQRSAEYTAIENALQNGHSSISVGEVGGLPGQYVLAQNYPNPFNPSTTISFSLPHSGNTSLKVFDMLGREVATLVSEFAEAGSHEVQFNAKNLASGLYYYKLTSGNFAEVKKMVLVK